jgi:predicted aspartyl protease
LAQLPLLGVEALIDTGASSSCIDAGLAMQLNLPIINRETFAGVGGLHAFNVHLAQIRSPELKFTFYGAFAGVGLAAGGQRHSVLIGRDFLSHFKMVYDGTTGVVTLSDADPPLAVEPWPDE